LKYSTVPFNSGSAKFRLNDCFESRTEEKLKREPDNDVDDDYKGMYTALSFRSESVNGNLFF
jgi:hypothetical protein